MAPGKAARVNLEQAFKLPRPAPHAVIKHVAGADLSIFKPASMVMRWYALTLDITFAGPLDVLVHMPFARYCERLHAFGFFAQYYALTILLTAIPVFCYFIVPTCLTGQTLGKRIVGIKIVAESGKPLGVWQTFRREVIGKALAVATCGFGIITMNFDPLRRTLHDLIAGTVVLALKPEVGTPPLLSSKISGWSIKGAQASARRGQ